jgi:hypothetical protein
VTTTARTFDARAFDADGYHVGAGPWLNAIWAINRIAPDSFGEPTTDTVETLGGGHRFTESYPSFTVVHLDIPGRPRTVTITALTPEAAELLAQVD